MHLEDVLQDPEFIPHVHRWLFEQITAGLIAPDRAVAVAQRVGVDLEAGGYAVVLFDLPPRDREAGFFSDPAAAVRGTLYAYFLKYSEYMPVQLAPNLGAVLVKGGAGQVEELTDRCVRTVREEYDRAGVEDWYLAASGPAARLEELPDCFRQASRLWALRVLRPDQRVFRPASEETILSFLKDRSDFSDGDLVRADPASIQAFLKTGRREDVPAFAARYLQALGPAMASRSFRDYALLSARAEVVRAAGELRPERTRSAGWEELGDPVRFLEDTLSAAIARRDAASPGDRGRPLEDAVGYVDRHFTEPDLTLARTAEHAGVTASYLSALFRQRMDCTFTQYVTGKRMELARRLLLTTDRRPGQIAREAGFRDPHYFNALFRKTQGCTPGQLRAGAVRD